MRVTAFNSAGIKIISASGDGTVRIWDLVGDDLFGWIETNRFARELTSEELEQFGIESSAN